MMKSAALAVLAAAVGTHATGDAPTPSHANFYIVNNVKASNFNQSLAFSGFPALTGILATDGESPGDKACDMTTLHDTLDQVKINICYRMNDPALPFHSFKVVTNTAGTKYGIEFWGEYPNEQQTDHCPDSEQMTHAVLHTRADEVTSELLSRKPVSVLALQKMQVSEMFKANGAPLVNTPVSSAATNKAKAVLAGMFNRAGSWTINAGTSSDGKFDVNTSIAFNTCHELFTLNARNNAMTVAANSVMVKVYKNTATAKCNSLSERDVATFCRGQGLIAAAATTECAGSSCKAKLDQDTCCKPVNTCGGSNGKAAKCIFPFTYCAHGNCETFNECTTVHHDQPWCYVSNDPYPGMKRWGNCDSTACTATSASSGFSLATTLLALGMAMRAMM